MTNVCIASSREADIGGRCRAWAGANLPAGFTLTDDPDACEVFISVLYGSLVSEAFIEPRRCFNFHPGLLPAYRGAGAFSWAILNGEKQCGVTLHELDVDIDTGPVIDTCTFPVEGWDTAETLFRKGMDGIERLFRYWLPLLLAGDYQTVPQDPAQARTYYRKDLRREMDLTRYARAFSFAGKEGAYYFDRHGQRHEVKW